MTILVTGGGFDVLHTNHKLFIQALINLTCPKKLVILLSSDKRLQKIKGNTRPLFTYKWREHDLKNWLSLEYADLPIRIVKIEQDSYTEMLPYLNDSNYIVGTKNQYSYIKASNLLTIDELSGHHSSNIVKTLQEAEVSSPCNAIKVGAVLVREGNIVYSSSNGLIKKYITPSLLKCSKCSIDLKNKCDYYHAEEVVLTKSKPGDYLFITYSPCLDCSKLILKHGIKRVVYFKNYVHSEGIKYLNSQNIEIKKAGI